MGDFQKNEDFSFSDNNLNIKWYERKINILKQAQRQQLSSCKVSWRLLFRLKNYPLKTGQICQECDVLAWQTLIALTYLDKKNKIKNVLKKDGIL